jgi:hypothetical protein
MAPQVLIHAPVTQKQGSHLSENKYTDKMKKKTDKVKKIWQMKNIEILAEHSSLGPGPWYLPVERLKRVNKLIQIQNSWTRG